MQFAISTHQDGISWSFLYNEVTNALHSFADHVDHLQVCIGVVLLHQMLPMKPSVLLGQSNWLDIRMKLKTLCKQELLRFGGTFQK